jgi:hypothetical protein
MLDCAINRAGRQLTEVAVCVCSALGHFRENGTGLPDRRIKSKQDMTLRTKTAAASVRDTPDAWRRIHVLAERVESSPPL